MKITKRIGAMAAALALTGGAALAAAPVAAAGECTWGICGSITNSGSSPRTLPVTCNFGAGFGDYREVSPGTSASCRDDDGFHTPKGYKAVSSVLLGGRFTHYYSHGWVKVNDLQSTSVRIYKL